MNTYENQNTRWKILGVGAATAAILGRKKIAAFALRGAETIAARLATAERTEARFALTRFADDVGRAINETIPSRARMQVGEQRLRGYLGDAGWVNPQVDNLFGYEGGVAPYSRIKTWISPGDPLPKNLMDDTYSGLRSSFEGTGKGVDEISADLLAARKRLSNDHLFDNSFGLPTDPRASSLQAQVARAKEEHQRLLARALTKRTASSEKYTNIALGQHSSWTDAIAEKVFGAKRVTVGNVLTNRANFTAEVIEQAEKTSKTLAHTLGKQADTDVINKAVLGELWTVNGKQVTDLRGASKLIGKGISWLNENVEIPLIPFVGGFSPFRLFPWLTGEVKLGHTLIKSNTLGKQALIKGLFSGNQDISLVGNTAVGMRFGDSLAIDNVISDAVDNITALHADYGLGEHLMRNLLASKAAKKDRITRSGSGKLLDLAGFGTGGNTIIEKLQNFFSTGRQPTDSVFRQARSIFTKFADPSKFPENSELARIAKSYPAGALERIYKNPTAPAATMEKDIRTVATLLQKVGKISPQNVRKTLQTGMFPNAPEVASVLQNIENDADIVKFFQQNRSYGLKASSKKLSILLEDFSVSPNEVLDRTQRVTSKSPLMDRLLGAPESKHGIDLMREALIDEYAIRYANPTELGITTPLITKLTQARFGLEEQELELAKAAVYGSQIRSVLEVQGAEAARDLLTKKVESSSIKETSEYVMNNFLGLLDIHTPPQVYEGPQRLLVKQHAGLIKTLNDITKSGGSFQDMIKQFAGSDFTKQYASTFVQGADSGSITRTSLKPYFFATRLNEALTPFGLGLNPENLGSGADIIRGLVVQRILPGVAAVEAWKYINYESENLIGARPEEGIANIRANLKLQWAGLNDWEKFAELHPGSKYYMSGLNKADMAKQLDSGYVPIRKGRFWLFGSRSAFYGDRVSYFMPDPYQLANSEWQGAENVDYNNKDYWSRSAIPTPRYPLSTINRLLDPYAFEHKHSVGPNPDRPYIFSGEPFTRETLWGPILNATIGKIIKPRRVLHPDYLPENLEETQSKKQLRALNEATKHEAKAGGGKWNQPIRGGKGSETLADYSASPMILTEGSLATLTSAGQVALSELPPGMSDPWSKRTIGGARRVIRKQLEKINRELKSQGSSNIPARLQDIYGQEKAFTAEQLEDVDYIGNAELGSYLTREMMGLYGWMAGIPLGDRTGTVMADASRAYSYERKYWEAELGGLGGFLCLTPNMLLQQDFGTPIEVKDITTGTTLLSRYGIPQEVLAVHSRHINEDIRCIETYCGGFPLSATSEHPVFAISTEYCEHKDGRKKNSSCIPHCNKFQSCEFNYHQHYTPEWIAAKYIKKGDYIAYPIPKQSNILTKLNIVTTIGLSSITDFDNRFAFDNCKNAAVSFPKELLLTKDLGKFLGLWLAEGSFGNRDKGRLYEIHFAYDRDEESYATFCKDFANSLGLNTTAATTKEGYWYTRVCNRVLAEFIFAAFGAKNDKRIPSELLNTPKEFLLGILEGLFRGDGHCRSDRTNKTDLRISIVAYKLALQIFNILIMLGYTPSLSIKNRKRRFFINDITKKRYKTKPQFCVTLNGNDARNLRDQLGLLHFGNYQPDNSNNEGLSWRDANFIYFKVKENYPTAYEGLVYDFTMDGDPSFCTIGMIVHNSEIGRRFMPHRFRQVEEYNTVPNAFEETWLPGSNYFTNFQTGDMYTKLRAAGEVRLPGSAYERIHNMPLMRTRASSLGKSVNELVAEMVNIKEANSAYMENIMDEGTQIHKKYQNKWKKLGILEDEEVELYNPELGISGHMDALLNLDGKKYVTEIKSMSDKRFNSGEIFASHLDQLNFYMNESGIHRGLLFYMNRDNPEQTRIEHVGYSKRRVSNLFQKVEEARSKVREMIDSGEVSRADLYDMTTRFEILADTCVHPLTYIRTSDGSVKLAKDVKVGDRVISHKGDSKAVTRCAIRHYSPHLIKLNVAFIPAHPLLATPEHPIYTIKAPSNAKNIPQYNANNDNIISDENEFNRYCYPIDTADWVALGDIRSNDVVLYPIPKKETPPNFLNIKDILPDSYTLREDTWLHPKRQGCNTFCISQLLVDARFAKAAGVYLAEGSSNGRSTKTHQPKGLIFSLNINEIETANFLKDYFADICETTPKIFTKPESNSRYVCVTNQTIGKLFCNIFGQRSATKQLPQWAFNLDSELQRQLLSSYFAGDGCLCASKHNDCKTGHQLQAEMTTISLKLALGIRDMLLQNGFVASVQFTTRKSYFPKQDRRQIYRVRMFGTVAYDFVTWVTGKAPSYVRPENRRRQAWIDGNYLVSKVIKTEKQPYSGEVYNWTIEDDNSFCVLGYATHNSPYSQEYKQLKGYLPHDDQLTEDQRDRFQAAKKRAGAQKKRLDLFPYRFKNANVEEQTYTVSNIMDANTLQVRESEHPLRLAGVRASNQRITDEYGENENLSPAEVLYRQYGIRKGTKVTALVNKDPEDRYADDVLGTQHAVVMAHNRNINADLIQTGVGIEKEEWSAAGIYARFTEKEITAGARYETISHADTMLNSKFLKIRSPYEEYVRSQVYGKKYGRWESAYSSYIEPTIQSYVAKGAIGAAVGAGVFSSLFMRTKKMRGKAALAGAAIGAGLSILRQGQEALTGEPWIPNRTQKRRDVEEYYDTLEYIKYRRLYEATAKLANDEEGTDVEEIDDRARNLGQWRKEKIRELEDKRRKHLLANERGSKEELAIRAEIQELQSRSETVALGPLATQAVLYQQKYRSTMYGADPGGPYMNIFRALPKYEREIINGLITGSTPEERKKAYRLLPDYEQRLLGIHLGIEEEDIPKRKLLGDYFKVHTLPGESWKGWSPEVDLEQLKARTTVQEHTDPLDYGFYPQVVVEAEHNTNEVQLPTVHGSSSHIQKTLNNLLSGNGIKNLRIRVNSVPDANASSDNINIAMNVRQNRMKEIAETLNLYG